MSLVLSEMLFLHQWKAARIATCGNGRNGNNITMQHRIFIGLFITIGFNKEGIDPEWQDLGMHHRHKQEFQPIVISIICQGSVILTINSFQ